MKSVYLSRGYFASIDDDILPIILQYNWRAQVKGERVYAITGQNTHMIYMHWFVIGHPIKGFVIDHIDNDGTNNKRDNLRIVTTRQNICNDKRNKSSIFPGVHWRKESSKWIARILCGNNRKCLGSFNNELDAFSEYRNELLKQGEHLLPEHEELYTSLKRMGEL